MKKKNTYTILTSLKMINTDQVEKSRSLNGESKGWPQMASVQGLNCLHIRFFN